MKKNWNIFINSVFFVLGFSVVFSLLGVLLQTVLANVSATVQIWLARIGGILIILFGLYIVGLIRIKFLDQDHKLEVNRSFKYAYLTSFIFGSAFAVGWTPCVGPFLGVVLTLAATNPTNAFFLLLFYSIGLGIPFMLVGLFVNQSRKVISKTAKYMQYLRYIFGALLILIGIFIFTNQLGLIANFEFLSNFLIDIGFNNSGSYDTINYWIALIAGFGSFLSPCVLPLIPSFLTYLASITVREHDEEK